MRLFEFTQKEIPVEQAKRLINREAYKSILGPKLYRGLKKYKYKAYASNIRTDRKPRTSTTLDVKVFNALMDYANFPFRKENTLSVANTIETATEYGQFIYKIFPFNGTEFLYSRTIEDFMAVSEIITHEYIFNYKGSSIIDELDKPEVQNDMINFVFDNGEKFLKESELVYTTNFSELQNAEGEILCYGKPYIAIFDKEL